jgi:hypothetical protein
MKWLIDNWSKSTIFLAIYLLIMLLCYVMNDNFLLFLIWVQTPIYFLHQFEEYIFPGGFVEFFNTKVLGSNKSDFPLNKEVSFWINIPIVFIAFPLSAILAGSIDISIGIWTAYFSILNALSHVGMFFKYRYNPGFVVSIFLNIPVGIFTIYYFISHDTITLYAHLIGLVIAVLFQLGVMIYGFKFLKPKVK